jgi:two-component system KDP operon response regulator KdpE
MSTSLLATSLPVVGPLVLVIDDELQIRRFLRISLEANGYQVQEAATFAEGLAAAARLRPDLLILDLGLPDGEGLELLRRLREWSRLPTIVLSARLSDADKVAALDGGADDYLTKPFSVPELLARLRVALRHAQPAGSDPVFRTGSLTVDPGQADAYRICAAAAAGTACGTGVDPPPDPQRGVGTPICG